MVCNRENVYIHKIYINQIEGMLTVENFVINVMSMTTKFLVFFCGLQDTTPL